jgi:hypothetical protein
MSPKHPVYVLKQLFSVLSFKTIRELAYSTQFIERNRKLKGVPFLDFIFKQTGNLSGFSLTELCSALSEQGVYMSKVALNNRFNERTVQFLKQAFGLLFEQQFQQQLSSKGLTTKIPFARVRILDGTTISLPDQCVESYPGTVGAGVKFQIEFDYLTGRFLYVELQPGKEGDSSPGKKRLQSVQKNDLVLQDLGYYNYKVFQEIDDKGAYYVSRARSDARIYIDNPHPRYRKNGDIVKSSAFDRLLLEEEASTMKRGETREHPIAYLGRSDKLPARLVIYRLTTAEQRQRESRIQRRAQKKPGQTKQKTKDMAGISVFVTNLPMSVPAKEVVALYGYRWQIELLFKSWKTDLQVDSPREMKKERWECHLYAELIILMLSTLITYQLRSYFWQEKNIILSEEITMREVVKKLKVLWRARDATCQNTFSHLEKFLAANGKKSVKTQK